MLCERIAGAGEGSLDCICVSRHCEYWGIVNRGTVSTEDIEGHEISDQEQKDKTLRAV